MGLLAPARRRLVSAGVLGPAVFVADWAVLGAIRTHYSPVHATISRLAATGASTQAAMQAGFVAYGASLSLFALSADELSLTSRLLVAATGLTTFGVVAFPVGTPSSEHIHVALAGLGYATLAGAPLVHARHLAAQGRRARAAVDGVVGVVCAGLLIASVFATSTGAFQRAGLTLGDAWIAVNAVRQLRGPTTTAGVDPSRR